MIAATLKEQKRTKIRFFAVYVASVVLIVIMISSLWKNNASASQPNATQPYSPTENEKLMRADALLHIQLEALDNRYSSALLDGKKGMAAERSNLLTAEGDFRTTLDSLEKVAGEIKDEQQRLALLLTVTNFRKSLEARSKLMNGYATLLNDTTRSAIAIQTVPVTNTEEMQELKTILVEKEQKVAELEKQRIADLAEKDRIILSLRNQVAQKTTVPVQNNTAAPADSEWRQKYARLKTSCDVIAGQNSALNKSYKAIVDDNRRLLSQLQAARKQ